MRKALPYILIAIVLFIGAGLYLQSTKNGDTLLPVGIKNGKDKNLSDLKSDDLFRNYGPAPEITGIKQWLNSDPITLESLKGKVVLVDFWTYSCINCIRTLPYITKLDEKYRDDGLVILGVHTPEFAFEKETKNVQAAIEKYNIKYPVAQDNDFGTWSAFKNQYWPAKYLIDQNGNIVYTHFGEGDYDITEAAVRTLLGLDTSFELPPTPEKNLAQTREIYFGLSRLEVYDGPVQPTTTQQKFTLPSQIRNNYFGLEGDWTFADESTTLTQGPGKIRLNFNASKVFMVAKSDKVNTIKVYIDGKFVKEVSIQGSDLYELYNSTTAGKHIIDIEIPSAGFEAFAFTFG